MVKDNNYCTYLLIIVIRFLHLCHFDFSAKKFGGQRKIPFSRTGLATQKHNTITILFNQKLSILNNPQKPKGGKLHLKPFLWFLNYGAKWYFGEMFEKSTFEKWRKDSKIGMHKRVIHWEVFLFIGTIPSYSMFHTKSCECGNRQQTASRFYL